MSLGFGHVSENRECRCLFLRDDGHFLQALARWTEYRSRGARKHVEASIYGKLEREMNLISSTLQLLARSVQITRHAV